MDRLKELNTFTKITLGGAILFLVYGVLSRQTPIKFFWEADTIGWLLLLVGVLAFTIDKMNKGFAAKQKTILHKIVIGLLSASLLFQVIFMIAIPNSDAYEAAKQFILNNEDIEMELGRVQGFGFTSSGGIAVQTDSNGRTGNANIELIVKGEKAYKVVNLILTKGYETDWEVVAVN